MKTRPDFSQYVAHFTKNGQPCADGAKTVESIATMSAFDRVIRILQEGKITATAMPWTGTPAVAFTECPWTSMVDHARAYSPYGIGFTKAHLFAAGGGPAVYMRPDLWRKQERYSKTADDPSAGLHPDLLAFVTPFVPKYCTPTMKKRWQEEHGAFPVDYTHEREWRVPHDFTFRLDQVQFIVVDSYEDVARFPKDLKDSLGRSKFVIMDVYRQIETLWPTHRLWEDS